MDLPADDPEAGWDDYVRAVLSAADGSASHPVVVGHSAGAFVAPLVCQSLQASELVLVAPTIPRPGERFMEFWSDTGHKEAQARWLETLGLPGASEDEVIYYHDVPQELWAEEVRRSAGRDNFPSGPWPLSAWPEVPTRVLACRDDRLLPLPYLREVARQRLGLEVEEIKGGHCVLLSHPEALAEHLAGGPT